jgi:hypothetical protein
MGLSQAKILIFFAVDFLQKNSRYLIILIHNNNNTKFPKV